MLRIAFKHIFCIVVINGNKSDDNYHKDYHGNKEIQGKGPVFSFKDPFVSHFFQSRCTITKKINYNCDYHCKIREWR